MWGQRIAGVAACAGSVVAGGCLVNSHSRTEYSGHYVRPETMERIEVGKTKQDFVLATLGEPTCKTPLEGGGEIWRWDYKKTQSGNGTVFLLFDGSSHTEHEGAAYVEFRDGVVAKKWRD